MESEQETPSARYVIAEALHNPGIGESPFDFYSDVDRILKRIDAAEFAIVRKPTGDQLEAALLAFTGEYPYPTGRTPLLVDAMAAALAAAGAVDGRTPDELLERIAFWGYRQGYYPGCNAKLGWSRLSDSERRGWIAAAAEVLKDYGRTPEDEDDTPPDLLAQLVTAVKETHAETGRMPYLVDLDSPELTELLQWAIGEALTGLWKPDRVLVARAAITALKNGGA